MRFFEEQRRGRRANILFFLLLFSSSIALGNQDNNSQGGGGHGRNSDPVIDWNQVAIDTIQRNADRGPGFPSRNMAIVHAAIFDTVNAIKDFAEPYLYKQEASRGTDLEVAVAGAAYTTLASLYPAQRSFLMARLSDIVDDDNSRKDHNPNRIFNDQSFRFGQKVAETILASRANDGSAVEAPYNPQSLPGIWLPTPPDFTPAWGPAWGQQKLFIISNRFAYLPPPPPALNSAAYAAAVNEVQRLGRSTGSTRTSDQTLAALFWSYDTASDGSPIVLYNQSLQTIAVQTKNSVEENARLFALANLAMADAGIVCWLAKFQYTLWRPIQAIRRADEDNNPLTIQDPHWTPLGIATGPFQASTITPPFPAYTSGHSTFGGALFETLRQFYRKDNIRFTLTSKDTPGVKRTYNTFSEAEAENGRSRIYMGVHYSFDNLNGIALGRNVGREVSGKLRPQRHQ